MNKALRPREYFFRSAGVLAIVVTFGTASTTAQEPSQPAQPPLEYDYCGSSVPATLPHMYQSAFRLLYKPKKDIPGTRNLRAER